MPEKPQPNDSDGRVLTRVAEGLRKDPPLLLGLGAAIVLGGVSAGAPGEARTVSLVLLGVVVAALVAWVVAKRRRETVAGEARADLGARVEGTVRGGQATVPEGTKGFFANAFVGRFARVGPKGRVEGGKVNVRSSSAPERDPE